jgi:hypothetical protein
VARNRDALERSGRRPITLDKAVAGRCRDEEQMSGAARQLVFPAGDVGLQHCRQLPVGWTILVVPWGRGVECRRGGKRLFCDVQDYRPAPAVVGKNGCYCACGD